MSEGSTGKGASKGRRGARHDVKAARASALAAAQVDLFAAPAPAPAAPDVPKQAVAAAPPATPAATLPDGDAGHGLDDQGARVLVFDTETTGTDPRQDQVIELCVQVGLGDDPEVHVWRIRPDVPIAPGAQAVHGISMDDLVDCPPFAAIADEVRALLSSADVLVGYNMRFDVDMVQAEYQRLRQPPLDLDGVLMVDPYRLWVRSEPRSLVDAHKRFAGGDFGDAHSAEADVAATGRVLQGMRASFGVGALSWEALADHIDPERRARIGGTQHLMWTEDGDVVVGFGKHRGRPLAELAAGPDAGYLRWIRSKDFPDFVRDACDAALRLSPADLRGWLHERFGPAPDLSGDGGASS